MSTAEVKFIRPMPNKEGHVTFLWKYRGWEFTSRRMPHSGAISIVFYTNYEHGSWQSWSDLSVDERGKIRDIVREGTRLMHMAHS